MGEIVGHFQSLKQQAIQEYKNNNFANSIALLTTCLEELPCGFKLESSQRAVLLSNRALAYLALNQFAPAVEDAENSLVLEPDNPKAQFRLAKGLAGLGDSAKAAYFAQKVVEKTQDKMAIDLLNSLAVVASPEFVVKTANPAPTVQAQLPPSTQTLGFSQLELCLRKSGKFPIDLTPEILLYFVKQHAVLFTDVDVFVNLLKAVDGIEDVEVQGRYKHVVRQVSSATVLAMLTHTERSLLEKLTRRF